MATQITSLAELNRFYMRTSICAKSEWAITCGPESVSTLKWKFSSDRIIVKENFKVGHAQVVLNVVITARVAILKLLT